MGRVQAALIVIAVVRYNHEKQDIIQVKKLYSRKVSRNERFWVAANSNETPAYMQFVLEGPGSIDVAHLRKAVKEASAANPGSRLIYKGNLKFSKWVDSGIAPPVTEVDGSGWSGMSSEGASFLNDPFTDATQPTCDVIVINGDPLRISFRAHHGVMDGRGLMTWMEDIFRVLRGEPPAGSDFAMNEVEFSKTFKVGRRKIYPPENIAPTGRATGKELGIIWQRWRKKGKFSDLIGQLCVIAASEARKKGAGIFRVGVPVDLRHRLKDTRATGNLTVALILEIGPEMTARDITEEIARQLKENHDVMLADIGVWLDFVPLWLMRFAMKRICTRQHKTGRYGMSGAISNLGKIPLIDYSCIGFNPVTCFILPNAVEYIPFLMTVAGNDNGLEIVTAMPRVLSGQGRLDNFMDNIIIGLNG